MIQEYKDLILKDICGRLPYGVKIECKWKTPAPNDTYGVNYTLDSFLLDQMYNADDVDVPFDEFKPYLLPLSSMTEEQKQEYEITTIKDGILTVLTTETYDCLNKHHIDYRGLIEKGLAIDATGLNIY